MNGMRPCRAVHPGLLFLLLLCAQRDERLHADHILLWVHVYGAPGPGKAQVGGSYLRTCTVAALHCIWVPVACKLTHECDFCICATLLCKLHANVPTGICNAMRRAWLIQRAHCIACQQRVAQCRSKWVVTMQVCYAFFLMLGTVGYRASLMFVRHIYRCGVRLMSTHNFQSHALLCCQPTRPYHVLGSVGSSNHMASA